MTAAYRLANSTSGGRGGGAVRFRPIQPVRGGGGGGCCPLSADSVNEVSALSADSTSGRWMLSAFSCMYVSKGGLITLLRMA